MNGLPHVATAVATARGTPQAQRVVEQLGSADVVVVGAGIVGLGHAAAALEEGASVIVIERDERAVGASVPNFGHVGATAQDGDALTLALDARQRWLRLAAAAGLWSVESGTVLVARADEEMDLLTEFRDRRDGGVHLLDADGVRRCRHDGHRQDDRPRSGRPRRRRSRGRSTGVIVRSRFGS